MPELPELLHFKHYVDSTALHQKITEVAIQNEQVLASCTPKQMKEALEGQSFESTSVYGKYLFLHTGGPQELVMHFGMTGRPVYFKNKDQQPDYPRTSFHLKNGYTLAFDCMRMLGQLYLTDHTEAFVKEKKLGPDVSSADFDFGTFRELMDGKRGMIKSSLMDQQFLAGIGNECSDEILFQSRVHPQKKVTDLTENLLHTIYENIQVVIETKLDALDHHKELPDTFILKHREEGAECPNCKGEIKRISVGGRSGYYCPHCQKK